MTEHKDMTVEEAETHWDNLWKSAVEKTGKVPLFGEFLEALETSEAGKELFASCGDYPMEALLNIAVEELCIQSREAYVSEGCMSDLKRDTFEEIRSYLEDRQ